MFWEKSGNGRDIFYLQQIHFCGQPHCRIMCRVLGKEADGNESTHRYLLSRLFCRYKYGAVFLA